jgi:hypothetical protein
VSTDSIARQGTRAVRNGFTTVRPAPSAMTRGRSASVYARPVTNSKMALTTAPKRAEDSPWTAKSATFAATKASHTHHSTTGAASRSTSRSSLAGGAVVRAGGMTPRLTSRHRGRRRAR